MAHNLGMAYRMPGPGMCPPDFKSPSESPQLTSNAPSNPKKRRKTSNAAANNTIQPTPTPSPQDLLPPPLTGYGDTIVASNPFDDTPPSNNSPMALHGGHMGMHGGHMGHPGMHMGPMRGGMNPMMNPNMSPMGMGIGPMPHMNNRGGMSPMPNPNAPLGGLSPMSNMDPRMGAMGGHMSPMGNMGRPMGSPMNSMPGMSSPMGMGSPNHMNNAPMGPPMHSPLANHMGGNGPPPRMNLPNGAMTSHQNQLPHHPMMSNQMRDGPGPNNNNNNNNNMPPGPGSQNNNMNNNHQGMQMGPSPGNPGNPNNNQQQQQHPPHPGMQNHGMQMGGMVQNGPMGMHPGVPSPNQGGNPIGMYGGPKPMPVSAGKVYPSDQPMVFNPQNPNAPPIYPCGVCHKEVHDNDQGLLCESGCNFWFHRTCSGLTEMAYQLMHCEVYAEWCCDKCLSSKNIPLVKFKP